MKRVGYVDGGTRVYRLPLCENDKPAALGSHRGSFGSFADLFGWHSHRDYAENVFTEALHFGKDTLMEAGYLF